MADDKQIPVYFARYEPYENIPAHTVELANVSGSALDQLMSKIASSAPEKSICMQALCAEYTDTAFLVHMPAVPSRHRTLELSGMWWLAETSAMPCSGKIRKNTTYERRMKICAENIRAGKCRDEFVRRTLGAALFPEIYAKSNQK